MPRLLGDNNIGGLGMNTCMREEYRKDCKYYGKSIDIDGMGGVAIDVCASMPCMWHIEKMFEEMARPRFFITQSTHDSDY